MTCSDTESVCAMCAQRYTLTSGICAAPAAALTDAMLSTAVASCLGDRAKAAAVDGLCTSYGVASGFGAMPDWDVGEVTNMNGVHFSNRNNFNAAIGNWNMVCSQCGKDMWDMFWDATAFDQDIELEHGAVTKMVYKPTRYFV